MKKTKNEIFTFLVKIIADEDGTKIKRPKWCAVIDPCGSLHALCSLQVFGMGEGRAEYITKDTGKVTCPDCIAIIKDLKTYKY